MVVTMRRSAQADDVARVVSTIEVSGGTARLSRTGSAAVIGVLGEGVGITPEALVSLPGVERVTAVDKSYRLAHRLFRPEGSVVAIGDVPVGGNGLVLMAGPCAVESEAQLLAAAQGVREGGAHILRGGAFKPRTSPYSFQGLGREGLRLLAAARAATGMPVVTEVMEPSEVEAVAEAADCLQVGARNMQNTPLLRAVGQSDRPVLLKRGLAATVDEWLQAAEYILAQGNERVILCERGLRGFDGHTRFLLDVSAVPVARRLTHLPIIVDPSHAAGDRELVPALARAAIAAGADGLIVEVHPTPDTALSDGPQALTPTAFAHLVEEVSAVGAALGRPLHQA
jgi:3-deoxy-7-phosphoheptulonate synthase